MRNAAMWTGLIAGFGLVLANAEGARGQRAPDVLESRAAALVEGRPDFAGAANAYRQAAALRTADDAQAVGDLRLAGLLYAGVGDMKRAAAAMEAAGEKALALGNFGAAAEAYTNAAFIAAKAGNRRAAVLAHRALWLVEQEGVSDAQRALIHQRLRPGPATI